MCYNIHMNIKKFFNLAKIASKFSDYKKKNILTLYEKTFGLINDDELDYDLSIYQNYLEEDI